MSVKDAGWIQLFAETNQEAVDLHIQAFRLAEELSCPVMVCMDGFILTHAYERVDVPAQAQVDAFLPAVTSRCRFWTRRIPIPSARWSGRKPSPRCAISPMTSRLQALQLIRRNCVRV